MLTFYLNVLEHIESDQKAVVNSIKLLKPGGKLIILVPAYGFLYNVFDKELGHYRRYTRRTLEGIVVKCGLQQIHSRYFNFAGIPGWFISGKFQKNRTIPSNQMKLYDALVPVFKVCDKIIFNSAGLSVVVTGTKSTASNQ